MKKQTKKQIKELESKISRLYSQSCSGVQIPMMSIPKVFDVARQAIESGLTDDEVKDKIISYVETIRVN